jgi:hypothetical protein
VFELIDCQLTWYHWLQVSQTIPLFYQVTGWLHVPNGYIVSSMEDEAGPGFGFTSFDTFMSSRLRYRPLLVGILWGSFLLTKTFRYDVMIWHCSYVWWSMNMNWSWCLSFSLLDGGSMKTNKATYRMIMIYKPRGVPTIYEWAILEYVLQTARRPLLHVGQASVCYANIYLLIIY